MKKAKYGVILLIIIIDQAVKAAVRNSFDVGESRDVLGDIFSLTYVQNTGAAFSMLTGMKWLLIIGPIPVILFGIWYMEKHKDQHWTLYAAVSLTVGGGISNIIDRLVLGYVTDMFDFHFWPVFNVADIAICVGCGILVIYVLKFYEDKTNSEK